ncbi:MAG: hypothetical protein N3D11_05690 [Candidatus Sumerlaeia bacterium]|nr:hypothetical protein [Candidatus Sumerlaeia bacterium]
MDRKTFLWSSLGLVATRHWSWADDLPKDIKTTRIVGFDLPTVRSKFAGKNAKRDDHGDRASDRMVRLYTNAGIEGLGNCRADEKALALLLEKNPFDYYRSGERRMTGPLGAGTMPLWDLAGKALNKPVYQLLGGAGPERVPVYDGSIYFADLLPQYASRWADRFKEEIDMGLKRGHRAFKVKIGRGNKWMPRTEGDARDVEVLKIIRQHGGPDIVIGADANDGYDLERTKVLLERHNDALNLAWLEEMFPEDVAKYLDLKQFIGTHGWKTLIADGETQSDLEAYAPFIAAKAVDIFQGDMNRFGFEGILAEAEMARAQGLLVAPHNWGSHVGFYMQLHVGRAITNFYRAEHDPLSTDVLVADGYEVKDGTCSVPDAPGFGLRLDEAKFASGVKVRFDLKA